MQPPTTSIDPNTGDVKVEWIAPNDGGDPITQYNVFIGDTTYTTFTNESTYCSSQTTSLTNLYCLVPMSALTSSPYSLTFG